MATDPSNADIMGAIGELKGRLDGVFRELDNAAKSRGVLHTQIEEQGKSIGNIQFEAEKTNGILSQTRDEVKALHGVQTTMQTEIKPLLEMKDALPGMVDTWRDMSKWTKRFTIALSIGGVSLIGIAIWAGDLLTQGVKHWLGIPPGG